MVICLCCQHCEQNSWNGLLSLLKYTSQLQKAGASLAALKQDSKGQADAREISKALEQEDILKHKDQASYVLKL